MSFKHDYLKQLCDVGGHNGHIVNAAIYFYHAEVPLDDAKAYICKLKQTLERTNYVGNIQTVEEPRPIRKKR
jgi:hypothetical protein